MFYHITLKDIINNVKKFGTWKIQSKIANNFLSSVDNNEERAMHSKHNNIEIMINDEADEVIKELFVSFKNRYQNNLESMKGSEFDYVQLLYCKCHKTNPNWIKNRKATINSINKKDNKRFQYALKITLNYEKIKKDLQRNNKNPFINKYNFEGINFPSEKDD